MTDPIDRASGGFFAAFAMLLYFVLIPNHVEVVDGGWLQPKTIPNAVAIVMGVCGVFLVIKPGKQQLQSRRDFLFAGLYFGLIAFGLWVMSFVGFVYTAPVLALIIMLMIGERRPHWLLAGVVGMPVLIWVLVAQLLERALP